MPAKNPKQYAKQHYKENKKSYVESSKLARQKKREWYNNIMKDKYCERCKESDPIVLEWHHKDPSKKMMEIGDMITRRGKKSILEEMDKCVCLCANCHRRTHHELRIQEGI